MSLFSKRKSQKSIPLKWGVLLGLCAFMTLVQPAPAKAQNVDPVAAAHWITSNAQWLAQQALQSAQWIANNILLSSGFSAVTNGIEVLERAEEKLWQAGIDSMKQSQQTAVVAKIGADATPSASTVACATQNAGSARNGAANAVGGLINVVTAAVAVKGKGTKGASGTAAEAAQNNCELQGQGNAWTFLDSTSYGSLKPTCANQ